MGKRVECRDRASGAFLGEQYSGDPKTTLTQQAAVMAVTQQPCRGSEAVAALERHRGLAPDSMLTVGLWPWASSELISLFQKRG